jgi:hypothetical protein
MVYRDKSVASFPANWYCVVIYSATDHGNFYRCIRVVEPSKLIDEEPARGNIRYMLILEYMRLPERAK